MKIVFNLNKKYYNFFYFLIYLYMQKTKLLEIKEFSNNIINIIDDLLLIKKNKGVKKITQSIDTSVGPNILEKYNIMPSEVITPEEKYKIVETIKKEEKKGNWSLVSKLVGLLLSTSSPPADSLKYQPSKKPLEMQYTSTAGEHNDKYNEQVFNDAEIQNLTINEVLEEPPVKAMMFDADLIAQKNKLKTAVVKPLLFDADLKAQKKRLKKTKEDKTTAQIEDELIPWWDKKKIKKLNINSDVKTELLDMIETLKNTNISEIDNKLEKQINKKIKKIEKFINTPEVKSEPVEIKAPKKSKKPKLDISPESEPEPKKKKQKITKNEQANPTPKAKKIDGYAEMSKEINKELKESNIKIKEREKKKAKPKAKVEDNEDSSEDEQDVNNIIDDNSKIINDQAFIDQSKDQLKEAGRALYALQKSKKTTVDDLLKFNDKYLKIPYLTKGASTAIKKFKLILKLK